MARSQASLMTAEEFYRLPDDDLRHELVRGRLVADPPPGFRHGRIAVALAFELETYARKQGNGIAVTCDVGFRLSCNPDTVRAPDVAILFKSRLADFDDDRGYFPGAPDLAVEVLSPSDRPKAVQAKIADYLDSGAQAVWIVDPKLREICVCTPAQRRVVGIDDVLDAPSLLPGFRLPLRSIFG